MEKNKISSKIGSYPVETRITRDTIVDLRLGKCEAYDIVYRTYKRLLEEFLTKLMDSREDAKEIIQDVFVNLWIKREQIDPDKNFKTYLFTIARNAAFNYFDSKRYFKGVSADLELLYITDGTTPDQFVIAKETEFLINLAVKNMPLLRRKVYQLKYDGLSYEEISRRLHISEESARKHLSRARMNIKALMI